MFPTIRKLADFLAVIAGFACARFLYLLNPLRTVPYTFRDFFLLSVGAGLVFLALLHIARLYERESSLMNIVETRRLILSWLFGSLLVFTASFYIRVLDLSRLMVTWSLLLTLLFLFIERAILFRVGINMLLSGNQWKKVVIYGAGVVGKHLYKRIHQSPALGVRVVAFLDDNSALWGSAIEMKEVKSKGLRVWGDITTLDQLMKEHAVEEVLIAMPSAAYSRNLEIADLCRKKNLQVSVVPPTYGQFMHQLEVMDVGGIPVIQERVSAPHFFYPYLKRLVDIVASLVLLILLSPVILLIAILIKMDSAGPIVFYQKRVGLLGKEFDFYKFRSMYVESNPYGLTPQSSADPRITKFGRWLRRSSLDELPQLLNVLKGDMSLVGPRPEMPFIVATYNEEQKERLRVKPGVTGIWQISAVRGEPIHANIEYDLFYINNRSLLLDIIIILRTLGTAIRGIGAY